MKGVLHRGVGLELLRIEQIRNPERFLDVPHTRWREHHVASTRLDSVVIPRPKLANRPVREHRPVGSLRRASCDDQRNPRFIDQNRIGFVDERRHLIERPVHEL